MPDGLTIQRDCDFTPPPPLVHVAGLNVRFFRESSDKAIHALSRQAAIELRTEHGERLETVCLCGDPKSDIKQLTTRLNGSAWTNAALDISPRAILSRYSDIILAMCVQAHLGRLQLSGGDIAGDLVLAHAIPLSITDANLWSAVLAGALGGASSDQFVLLARSDLILTDPNQVSREFLLRRHSRLIRRNRDLVSAEPVEPREVLARWASFAGDRFNESHSRKLQAFLNSVFSGTTFSAFEYRHGDEWVASSLVYRDRARNILFDILAPWNPAHAPRRPGVYTAVRNLLAAKVEGLRYSLCYGRFPYKTSIVRGVPEAQL